jgi:hypothetical protein
MMQVLSKRDNDGLNEGLNVVVKTFDEVTEEELFSEAYRLFGVASGNDEDDDLITNPENIKPIDWSSDAQNRSVDFPLLDIPGKVKNRPALCSTPPIGKYHQVIVAPITSKTNAAATTDVVLEASDA